MKLFITFCLSAFVGGFMQAQPELGIAQGMTQDSLLSAVGFKYLVESVPNCMSPRSFTDNEFEEKLKSIKNLKTSLYAVNVFIPGELKLVGSTVDEKAILEYVDIVFRRCQQANVKLIVWGSGGARRVPDGFDKIKAKEQFVSIARKVAGQAAKYQITLALENLNSTETNFITTLTEALDVVKQVNHPNFRLCADIYHMLKENEPASVIERARKYLVHCDLAEKVNRAAPGTSGEDFRPYLKALKKVKYNGKLILECRWDNLTTQAPIAISYIQNQIQEVYNQK